MNQENLNALIEMNNKLGSDLPAVQESRPDQQLLGVHYSRHDQRVQYARHAHLHDGHSGQPRGIRAA